MSADIKIDGNLYQPTEPEDSLEDEPDERPTAEEVKADSLRAEFRAARQREWEFDHPPVDSDPVEIEF